MFAIVLWLSHERDYVKCQKSNLYYERVHKIIVRRFSRHKSQFSAFWANEVISLAIGGNCSISIAVIILQKPYRYRQSTILSAIFVFTFFL